MARKGILYEQVTAAIIALQKKKQKVTVRAIHACTGGSMSTVLKHYRRWQGEQLGQPVDNPDFSPALMEALRNELHNHARRALLAMESRLTACDEKRQQAESARDEALARLADSETAQQNHAGEEARKLASLEEQLRRTLQEKARTESALHRARQQADQIAEHLATAESTIATLETGLSHSRNRIHALENELQQKNLTLEEMQDRALQAEAVLREQLQQDKPRSSRPGTSVKSPAPKPTDDDTQEAFEF
jgi:predicted  nucleic acid-binding Zn-ribbon protein